MAFIEVDEDNFERELGKAFEQKHTVIIKFGSEYCDPCHALECELEELDEMLKNLTILMVDTNEAPALTEQFDVYQLPTMLIYKERERTLYHGAGVILASDIQKLIEEAD